MDWLLPWWWACHRGCSSAVGGGVPLAGWEDAAERWPSFYIWLWVPQSLLDYSWLCSYGTYRLFLCQNSSLAASSFLSAVHRYVTRPVCTDTSWWGGVISSCSFLTSSASDTCVITPKRSLFKYICHINYLVKLDFMIAPVIAPCFL